MLDKFLEYLHIEKRYSINTIKGYRRDIEDFSEYISSSGSRLTLLEANKKLVRGFMVFLSEKQLSKRTINRKLSSLRSFYQFLLKIGEMQVSPLETIDSLKQYPPKQIPLSLDESQLLLEVLSDPKTDPLERMIIEVLYQTGMRRAELCSLRIQDVDFSKQEFRITGKGNKQRIVPFSASLSSQLFSLISSRSSAGLEEFYFLNDKGKKLNEKFVYSTVKKYLSLVTSKEKRSPHILRHSFATHVLGNGAEISKVKALLGHSSLASTQVYTDSDIESLKKAYKTSHPRARKEQ